jgi:hypothetical protein
MPPWSNPQTALSFGLRRGGHPALLGSSRGMVSLSSTSPCFRQALNVLLGSPAYSLLGLNGEGGVPLAQIPASSDGPVRG